MTRSPIPRQGKPVSPGWEDRIRRNLKLPPYDDTEGPEQRDRIAEEIAQAKELQAEHYIQQANALRWEQHGEALQFQLRALIAAIAWHKGKHDECRACIDRASQALELLQSIK